MGEAAQGGGATRGGCAKPPLYVGQALPGHHQRGCQARDGARLYDRERQRHAARKCAPSNVCGAPPHSEAGARQAAERSIFHAGPAARLHQQNRRPLERRLRRSRSLHRAAYGSPDRPRHDLGPGLSRLDQRASLDRPQPADRRHRNTRSDAPVRRRVVHREGRLPAAVRARAIGQALRHRYRVDQGHVDDRVSRTTRPNVQPRSADVGPA